MAMAVTLYFAQGACSVASLIALEEAGVRYHGRRVQLAQNEQRGAEFLAVNPRGRVPVLAIDDQIITETVAILTAVAWRFPDAGLLPFGDPVALARALELLAWFATGPHIAFAQVFRPARFTPEEALWPSLREGGRANVVAALDEIEASLSRSASGWLAGPRFSVADAYAYVFWRWAPRLQIDVADYPAFAGHARRLHEREAVQRALAREAAPPAAAAAA